jgi:formamidopyrimidine-DNA glycosylase
VPELPEVETIVRSLRTSTHPSSPSGVISKTISRADVLWQRSLAKPTIVQFQDQIEGQQILTVDRRGKFLVFTLTRQSLLIHLRMSGDIFFELDETTREHKHDRIVLHFTDGSQMAFNDTRKFGRVWLVDDPMCVAGSLGPEPLDEKLTAEVFFQKLQQSKRQIKPLLLDQTFLAGLGNIYTDEALFNAGIHPLTSASRLDVTQAAELLETIRGVLLEGVERNGASIDWVYRGGDFQNHFKVYQRDGQPCLRCGSIIERITVRQRGTHFCPTCQPRFS